MTFGYFYQQPKGKEKHTFSAPIANLMFRLSKILPYRCIIFRSYSTPSPLSLERLDGNETGIVYVD